MALSIKDPETDRLARAVAALTGESLTTAIRTALAERLAREQQRHGRRRGVADRLRRSRASARPCPSSIRARPTRSSATTNTGCRADGGRHFGSRRHSAGGAGTGPLRPGDRGRSRTSRHGRDSGRDRPGDRQPARPCGAMALDRFLAAAGVTVVPSTRPRPRSPASRCPAAARAGIPQPSTSTASPTLWRGAAASPSSSRARTRPHRHRTGSVSAIRARPRGPSAHRRDAVRLYPGLVLCGGKGRTDVPYYFSLARRPFHRLHRPAAGRWMLRLGERRGARRPSSARGAGISTRSAPCRPDRGRDERYHPAVRHRGFSGRKDRGRLAPDAGTSLRPPHRGMSCRRGAR